MGTLAAVFDPDYLAQYWLVSCWANLLFWLFALNRLCKKLLDRSPHQTATTKKL
jgi:hypothetical protein